MTERIDIAVRLLPADPASPGTAAQVAAWFIPGRDPLQWFEELVVWGDDLLDVECLVVGRAADHTIHGLLAIFPQHRKPSSPLGPRCTPYVSPVPRLFLPADAKLDPPLVGAALSTLLPSSENRYVWHPTAGFVAFEPNQVLAPATLLSPLSPRETAWDRAVPGTAINSRLHSIEPLAPPNPDDTLSSLGGDIGEKGSSLSQLPPDPSEPTSLEKMGQSVRGNIGKAISAFSRWVQSLTTKSREEKSNSGASANAGNPPQSAGAKGGAGGSSWLRALQNWAEKQIQRLSEQLQDERNKELARLMKMLERDPDAGLRYAIPFGGDNAYRGLGSPGSRLSQSNVDFSLSGIGGGGAVDPWDIGPYRQKLLARYRELASREIALGRHRRAAYIFAQLLGDLNAAAKTLEDGGHYREAAIVYEHKLKNLPAAARCFQSGQLWSEALALYERLGEYETIGDLHRRLDDEDAARHAYLRAAEQKLLQDDPLAASTIMRGKLNDVDRALSLLWGQWPISKQASAALREAVRVSASLGRHDEVRYAVDRITSQAQVSPERLLNSVDELAEICETYPDPRVRGTTEFATRKLVATRLEEASPTDALRLTKALARLVPSDKLLATDCRNYSSRRAGVKASTIPAGKKEPIEQIAQWKLPDGPRWTIAAASHRNWYAAGWQSGALHIVRGTWSGRMQEMPEPYRGLVEVPLVFAVHAAGLRKVLVHPTRSNVRLPDQTFATLGGDFEETVTVGGHDAFDAATQAATYAEVGRLVVASIEGVELRLREYTPAAISGGGTTLAEDVHDFVEEGTFTEDDLHRPFIRVGHHGATTFATFGHSVFQSGANQYHSRVSQTPHELAVSSARQRGAIALGFETGAMFLADNLRDDVRQTFAYDLAEPKLAFLGGGYLIAAAERGIEANAVHSRGLRMHESISSKRSEVVAVLPCAEPAEFGVLEATGTMTVYRVR
jgi:tetratricopeptide (TPR) repeat protein